MLINSSVAYQLKEIYYSVNSYLQSKYGASVQPKITNLFLHYVLATRMVPAVAVISRVDSNQAQGFVPKWPNLWQNSFAFKYCEKVLMLRFNKGRIFDDQD
jgi:hypothetical protein